MTKSRSSTSPGSDIAEPIVLLNGNEYAQIPDVYAAESNPGFQEYLHGDFLALPSPGVPFFQYSVSNT
jgi:hypothetical protein